MLKQTKAKKNQYFFYILTDPSKSKHNTKSVHEKNSRISFKETREKAISMLTLQ